MYEYRALRARIPMRWPECSIAHGDWLLGMAIRVRGTPNADSVTVLTFDRHDAGAPFCAAPLRFVRVVLAIVGCHLTALRGQGPDDSERPRTRGMGRPQESTYPSERQAAPSGVMRD